MTRTFHMGEPSEYQKMCFSRVLQVSEPPHMRRAAVIRATGTALPDQGTFSNKAVKQTLVGCMGHRTITNT